MEQALKILDLYDEVTGATNSALVALPVLMKAFIEFAKNQERCRKEWQKAVENCEETEEKLLNANKDIADLERQVQTARRLLDEEKAKRQRVLEERNQAENQLDMVRELLNDNRNKLNDETKEKLCFLSKEFPSIDLGGDRLDTIAELESTGSVMSDLSYTRDEDELLNLSSPRTRRSKRRPSTAPTGGAKRRRKSSSKKVETSKSDRLIAKTTVTVEHSGPMSATSVIETIPSSATTSHATNNFYPSAPPLSESDSEEALNRPYETPSNPPFSMSALSSRPHHFQSKAMIKGEMCNVCCKRIRFSALGAKCTECKALCHNNCKDLVPIPCVPIGNTPSSKGSGGSIADYTPSVPPMIPSLVVHCIKEVEARGLSEIGIYRIPGSDREVKSLKERFLKGKGVPNLSQIADIHVICGCLKDFIRSLRDPLITQIKWRDFVKAAEIRDLDERRHRLMDIVSDLPQPNRDTLAFIILHLQRIAEIPECKMPVSNLAKIFGPTIIGFSRSEPEDLYEDSNSANRVMGELLMISNDFWKRFIQDSGVKSSASSEMQKTPSSHSLNFFSTPGRVRTLKKIKYFETP